MSVSGRNCVASESAAADSTDEDDKEKMFEIKCLCYINNRI